VLLPVSQSQQNENVSYEFHRIKECFHELLVERWVIIDNGCESEEAVCLFELLQCAAADLLAFLNFALVLLAGHLLLLLLPVQLLQNHPPLLLLQSDLLQQSLLLDFVALELRLPPSLLLSLVLLALRSTVGQISVGSATTESCRLRPD
jgi:hypothetical protein